MHRSYDLVTEHSEGALIAIKVRPGSSRQGFKGMDGERLVVCVHSPPEKGKANREVLKVLAEALDLPASSLEIVKGNTSRRKTVLARGLTPGSARSRIGSHMT